jgi:hypothetical protein
MEELIQQACGHINGIGPHIEAGRYDLVAPDGSVILPSVWDLYVKPGWLVSMRMWPEFDEEKKKEEEAFKKKLFEEVRAEVTRDKETAKASSTIKFKDAVGRKFTFPFADASTWQVRLSIFPMYLVLTI